MDPDLFLVKIEEKKGVLKNMGWKTMGERVE
jgi:hypothetical protein